MSAESTKGTKNEPTPPIDNKILRMMKLMGYSPGAGLGKNKQGITTQIDIKTQLGKRGLGLDIKNLNPSNNDWNFDLDLINVEEKAEWLSNNSCFDYSPEVMNSWLREGPRQSDVGDEYNFCDKEVLVEVIEGKNIFDELDLKELNQARARANPFETIRNVFFLNRAALKMANIDAATGFMFTKVDEAPNLGPHYFADVCAGPGGFSEYILWRKKWGFKGFGFTLRVENDFKLTESVCASPATFLPLYGSTGDGNVCCPENIDDFRDKVLHETEDQGVHFMMSDGGFCVDGNENLQEVLSKSIYICQCLMALEILRRHGNFVTKVFDVFTPFSVGLLFLMYQCFEKVAILKPNSSRPANSERYFICANLRKTKNVQYIRCYLRRLVRRLWDLQTSQTDVLEIVPLEILQIDKEFFSYICRSNNRIARTQTINLKKLASFCRNPRLVDHRQEELRKKCLEFWEIPDKPRVAAQKLTPDELVSSCIRDKEILFLQARELSGNENFDKFLRDFKDCHYAPLQSGKNSNTCHIYACVGTTRVFKLQGRNSWTRAKNLYLPRGTLLYGEMVREKTEKESGQEGSCRFSLHVIDALRLGDVSLVDLKFEERRNLIEMYCKAVNHEFRTNFARIRPKTIKPLQTLTLDQNFSKHQESKNYSFSLPVLGHKAEKECFDVNSLLLLNNSEDYFFTATYVLRMQLFIGEAGHDEHFVTSLDKLREFLKI